MSLNIKDHFEYNPEIGTYDFTLESPKIQRLRSINKTKDFLVESLPLTIIAYREYGDHTLWWIIATYNSIITVDDFQENVLKIPDIEEVKRVLK